MKIIKEDDDKTINEVDKFIEMLSKCISYVYISSERTNQDILWEHNTIFQRLVLNHLREHTRKRDNFTEKIKRECRNIHDRGLRNLEKQLASLYMQNQEVNFKIDFPKDFNYEWIFNNLEISIGVPGMDKSRYLLEQWGSGTKSLAIIAMYRANALFENKSIVLGIEEPETNLHPQAQKKFIQSLSSKMAENEVQAIFTTHSTVLVDELEHENIVLVRREKTKNKNRFFKSSVCQMEKDFWNRCGIASCKHYKFFQEGIRNSEFFFSRYVIICEGPNDAAVLKKMISLHCGSCLADVSFIVLSGVKSLAYPYFLLKELKIPFAVVVDKDFLFKYKNDDLEQSRSKNGLPQYKKQINDEESTLKILKDLFGENYDSKIRELEKTKSHTELFGILEKYQFYSMQYCLEMDLTCSKRIREKYYEILNIGPENRNQKYLLEKRRGPIKKQENILAIITNSTAADYPLCLQKMKNSLVKNIQTYC